MTFGPDLPLVFGFDILCCLPNFKLSFGRTEVEEGFFMVKADGRKTTPRKLMALVQVLIYALSFHAQASASGEIVERYPS